MPDQSSLPYSFPEAFDIGRRNRNVRLLVQPQQLKGHLSMLHAFHKLRMTVESDEVPSFPLEVRNMEPEQRWGWFVNIAVERFDRWCQSLGEWCLGKLEYALPPLDVLMVWHAYLLNPIWYAEDVYRGLKPETLPSLACHLSAYIDAPDIFITDSPHPRRVRNWERRTSTSYDPLKATPATSRWIVCPHCEHRTVVPFIGPGGSGYAQKDFVTTCASCGESINKKLLGLYKFAKDIASAGFLAGTLHTSYVHYHASSATRIKKTVMHILGLPKSNTLTASKVMETLKFDPKSLSMLLDGEILQVNTARKILIAYTDDRPFSIELAGAVLRQALFVRKMADLRWTDRDFFAGDEELVLQHCIARYHAFLGLLADNPSKFFVPTLDIDLAWHTHQLRANHYHTECKRYVGRYVNHDDKVDENHLSNAFDTTSRAWTERYGLPYTYCGCPPPGRTLAQRLIDAFSRYRPLDDLDALKLRLSPAALGGTHPSDHNAVYVKHNRKAAKHADTRRQKVTRRMQAQVGSLSNSGGSYAHEVAFLYPIPMGVAGGARITLPSVVENGACATGITSCLATCTGASAVHANEATVCGGGDTDGGGSATVSNCGIGACGGGCTSCDGASTLEDGEVR